jgi:hypothetical protein
LGEKKRHGSGYREVGINDGSAKKDLGQYNEENKRQILELKANFSSEMTTNRFFYEKMKKKYLEFGTSTFQLMHVPTQKYLSLKKAKNDNLEYEFTDYPSKYSFFSFLPCLKIQLKTKLKNKIQNQDLVYLVSAAQIFHNQMPALFIDYNQQVFESQKALQYQPGVKVVIKPDIHEKTQLRINFYYREKPNTDRRFINIQDAVWLSLSETNHHLTAKRVQDPFETYFYHYAKI